MKYEYTCRYEDSAPYINKIITQLIKKNGGFINFLNIDEILSTATKNEFKSWAQKLLEMGYLEIWFNPQVVELANSLVYQGIVTKGSEIRETLQILQSDDTVWDYFSEGPYTFVKDYLNEIPNNNIPYMPVGGNMGTNLKEYLQKSYDDGNLLKYPLNEILIETMGSKIQFMVGDVKERGYSQKLSGNYWHLYSEKLGWHYGAGWAVFKIPLQHPAKPFMNWDESPFEVKE